VPDITVVAKKFTFVQAAEPRSLTGAASFYSKRFASCHIPRNSAIDAGLGHLAQLEDTEKGIYLSPVLKGYP
jgi:hypothetical protein